ncbi:MAG TPA: DUF2911 domain-containing protein [Sphingobacteriaceae bacterium]|nr:DUF2911 domain-containing protein [Sphingobacteriaceae bacterium]
MIKKHIFLFALALTAVLNQSFAQVPYNSAISNGPSKNATVSEQIGLTQVTITYRRPAVNGRGGKIWGGLVHEGFTKQGFGFNNPAPWRAGANENTIIEFDKDVKVEGQILAKGKYALFIAYYPLESTIIFSKKTDAWGSFFYDEKDDVLRVKVKPMQLKNSVEWLRYEFSDQKPNSAMILLEWDNLAIPFKIEVDALEQQFEALSAELKNPRGFTWQGFNIAANWSLQNNYKLEQGFAWADFGISNFGGNQQFLSLATKSRLLEKLGNISEADKTIKQALPLGNINEIYQYGRQLLGLKKMKEALEIFKFNYDKNPTQFIALIGMSRGLSENGDFKQALEFAIKALPLAPNEPNKQLAQSMIDKLKLGKEVN